MEWSFTDCEDCTAYKCTVVSAATSSKKGIFVDRPCTSQMFTSIFYRLQYQFITYVPIARSDGIAGKTASNFERTCYTFLIIAIFFFLLS